MKYSTTTDNTKVTRMFVLLSEAKEKGVKENDLFDSDENSNYVGVLKNRLNKTLGCKAVVSINGVWYLEEEFWSMTKSEFKDLMNRFSLDQISIRNNYTIFGVVAIFAVLLVITYVTGVEVGSPDTLKECGFKFGREIILEEDLIL